MCVSGHREVEEGAVTIQDEQRYGFGCSTLLQGAGLLLGICQGGCVLFGRADKTPDFWG